MVHISIISCISSFICTTIFYPIDSIKTRLQCNKIIKVNKLYHGIRAKYAENIISSSAFWTIYEHSKEYDSRNALIYSSLVVPLLETPLDIYRKQQQLGLISKLNAFKLVQYGILNYSINALGNYLFVMAYKLFENKDVSFKILPGLLVTSVLYPLDLAKTNILYPVSKEYIIYSFLSKCCYITGYSTLNMEIMKTFRSNFLD